MAKRRPARRNAAEDDEIDNDAAAKSLSLDALGSKALSESVKILTKRTMDGAAAFLSRICLPAAKEFGLLLQDKVKGWRTANAARLLARAEEKLAKAATSDDVHAHPRLVNSILEEGSWNDDPVIQDLWAGLLASSCTESGDDDSNVIFANLLANMTKVQARLLKFMCEKGQKGVDADGIPITGTYAPFSTASADEVFAVTGIEEFDRVASELMLMHQLGLINARFVDNLDLEYQPRILGLALYVRCQGSRKAVADYFGLKPSPVVESEPVPEPLKDKQPPRGGGGGGSGGPRDFRKRMIPGPPSSGPPPLS